MKRDFESLVTILSYTSVAVLKRLLSNLEDFLASGRNSTVTNCCNVM